MTYTPQPGTTAHRVAVILLKQGDGASLLATVISEEMDLASDRLHSSLLPGTKAGFFLRETLANRQAAYSLSTTGRLAMSEQDLSGLDDVRQSRVPAKACNSIFAIGEQRDAAAFSTMPSDDGRTSIQRYGRLLLEMNPAESDSCFDTMLRHRLANNPAAVMRVIAQVRQALSAEVAA